MPRRQGEPKLYAVGGPESKKRPPQLWPGEEQPDSFSPGRGLTRAASSGALRRPRKAKPPPPLATEHMIAWEMGLGSKREKGVSMGRPARVPSGEHLLGFARVEPSPHYRTAPISRHPSNANISRQGSTQRLVPELSRGFDSEEEEEEEGEPSPPSSRQVSARGASLSKAQADACRARDQARHRQAVIERQRVELESLRGVRHGTLVRVASEEATMHGVPWGGSDLMRFSNLQKTSVPPPPPSAFHSDEMREVMAQAVVATSRRVAEAVAHASNMRAESEVVERNGQITLAQAFPARVEAILPLEAKAKMISRAILASTTRTAARLRAALQRLEEEATRAATAHVTDMRSLAARLVGEREAAIATLSDALHHSEFEGDLSIAALQSQVAEISAALGESGAAAAATAANLRAELADTKERLKEEKAGRAHEYERLTTSVRQLKAENTRLTAELGESRWQHFGDVHYLRRELKSEEGARWQELREAAEKFAAHEQAASAALRRVEAQLADARTSAGTTARELQEQLVILRASKDSMEARMLKQVKLLEDRRQYEVQMLRTRNDALQQQVLMLKSNTVSGRQKLYWEAVKSSIAPREDRVSPPPGLTAPTRASSAASLSSSMPPAPQQLSPFQAPAYSPAYPELGYGSGNRRGTALDVDEVRKDSPPPPFGSRSSSRNGSREPSPTRY